MNAIVIPFPILDNRPAPQNVEDLQREEMQTSDLDNRTKNSVFQRFFCIREEYL